jgi:hypothetical protein
MKKKSSPFFIRDLAIVFLSVMLAIIMVKSGTLESLLRSVQGLGYIGSFVAGMFFTSVFTTAPSIAVLGEIGRLSSPFINALCGACGAVIGDLVMFRFIRDEFSAHLAELISHSTAQKRVLALVKMRSFRWVAFVLGGLIIASPLPDELGITLLGLARIKPTWFIVVSFVFNFIGILAIGSVARLL